MSSGYGCWSQLTDDEKKACIVTRNPKQLHYRLGKTLLAHRAAGKVQEEWQSHVLPQLTARISEDGFRYAISRGNPIPDSIVWTLYLVGETSDVDNLRPTIVAECADKATAELGCKALKKLKSGLGVLLKNYDIHYRHNVIRLRTSDDGQTDEPNTEPPVSLCGTQALLESTSHDRSFKVSTIGGAIIVDGKHYALTTAHAFSADDHDPSVFGPQEPNGIDTDENGHSRIVPIPEGSLSDSTIKSRVRAKDPLTHLRCKVYVQECDPTLVDPKSLSVKVEDVDQSTLLNNQSSTIMLNRHEDWALVPIDNNKYRTANYYMSPGGQSLPVTGITDVMPFDAVTAATGVSCLTETSFIFQSMMLLPSARKPRVVWVADMQTAPGDSGSWLIDEHGKACAMIVAASEEDNEAFCLPLVPIFESIRDSLKASAIPSTEVSAQALTTQDPAVDRQSHEQDAGSAVPHLDRYPHVEGQDTALPPPKPHASSSNQEQANPVPLFAPLPERDIEVARTKNDDRKMRPESGESSSDELSSDQGGNRIRRKPSRRRDKRRRSSSDATKTISAARAAERTKEQSDELKVAATPPRKETSAIDSAVLGHITSLQVYEGSKREAELKKTKEHHEVAEKLARLAVYEEKERQAEREKMKKRIEKSTDIEYYMRDSDRVREAHSVERDMRVHSPQSPRVHTLELEPEPPPRRSRIPSRYEDSRPSYYTNDVSQRMLQTANYSSTAPDLDIVKYKAKLRTHLGGLGYDDEDIDRIMDLKEPNVVIIERSRDRHRHLSPPRYTQPQIALHADWDRDPDRVHSSQIQQASQGMAYNTGNSSRRRYGLTYDPDQMDVLLLKKFGIEWTVDENGKIFVLDGLSVHEAQMLLDLSKNSDVLAAVETVKSHNRFPKAGTTRMPKRLVHSKVLFDLGYPFYEADDSTFVIGKALSPDNIEEVFSKSREALPKAMGPLNEPKRGIRSTISKNSREGTQAKDDQLSSHSKNMEHSPSDAKNKGAKSKQDARKKAAKPLPKATSSQEPSHDTSQADTRGTVLQSRPRSASRHRKNTGPQQAKEHAAENKNNASSQAVLTDTQDPSVPGRMQADVVAAFQAEDLQYEADVQTLLWQQNLPVELCDQILQLHSEKEARFDAFWRSKSTDVSEHDASSQPSKQTGGDGTSAPADDLKTDKKPTEPAGSSSHHQIKQMVRLTKTKQAETEVLPTEDPVDDDPANVVVVEEEDEGEEEDGREDNIDIIDITPDEMDSDQNYIVRRKPRAKRATVEFADDVY